MAKAIQHCFFTYLQVNDVKYIHVHFHNIGQQNKNHC